jgi:hypothetical protein
MINYRIFIELTFAYNIPKNKKLGFASVNHNIKKFVGHICPQSLSVFEYL